jgi:hypothetical protein
LEKKLIGKIICWYATSKDLAIKEAAAYAITNIVDRSYNKKQIKLLVEEECTESLCDMLKSDIGDIGKVIMALKKIQRASTDYNTRILNLAGREIFGSLIGRDSHKGVEFILRNFIPPVYGTNPRRKAIIIGQTKELYYVKSDIKIWKTTLEQNLGCKNIVVIKNGSKNEITTKLKSFVSEGLPGDILLVYITGHSHDHFGETSIEPVKLHKHQKGESITGIQTNFYLFISIQIIFN